MHNQKLHDFATKVILPIWELFLDGVNIIWFCRWRKRSATYYDPTLDEALDKDLFERSEDFISDEEEEN
jgi:hypothetical protein